MMPSLRQIAHEWNRNAASRCDQLATGKDTSHDSVLLPAIFQLAGNLRGRSVLDIGCGCGFLTCEAAKHAKSVHGIDISTRMIREARLRHRRPNLSFERISVEDFALEVKNKYDLCLANMSIITMPSLQRSLRAVAMTLKSGARLIMSIAHPCFWNTYRKDEPPDKFDYWRCHAVKARFRITLDEKPLPVHTTYFHRPLSVYFSCLTEAGFQVGELTEPAPPRSAPKVYRQAFKFPRFLILQATRRR